MSIKETYDLDPVLDWSCRSYQQYKMKAAIVALCIVACAYGNSDEEAKVLQSNYELSPSGDFQYGYETDNGIQGSAQGKVKAFGKDEVALEVSGSNSYKSSDGQVYRVDYVADENGFRPTGDHLPTPPAPVPIPEYIEKAIAYIAAHPYTETE